MKRGLAQMVAHIIVILAVMCLNLLATLFILIHVVIRVHLVPDKNRPNLALGTILYNVSV